MDEVIRYVIFPTVITGLLCIPGILFDIWLCKIGVSRESNKPIIILGTLFFTFLREPFFNYIPWWAYGIIVILGSTLAIHRSDLGETMKHGKWWWRQKPENKIKKRSVSL